MDLLYDIELAIVFFVTALKVWSR